MPLTHLADRFFVLLALLISLAAAACGGGGAGPENVYIADEDDNGQSVTMSVGDMLQLMLAENPTTGYTWAIVTNDEDVLAPSGEPAYEVESEAIGAGGTKTFMFQALAPGTSVLQMVNAMQWETPVVPAETFELTIQVVE
jgi:inhibitor of cysteine peptidase